MNTFGKFVVHIQFIKIDFITTCKIVITDQVVPWYCSRKIENEKLTSILEILTVDNVSKPNKSGRLVFAFVLQNFFKKYLLNNAANINNVIIIYLMRPFAKILKSR